MILFPAIDLKDGQCVRLLRGALEAATVYSDDPAGQARTWESHGFSWLHLVDLNGAVQGQPVNARAVEAILANVSVPVQLGGGIRDEATVAAWLERGVRRVILGTAALHDPELVRRACARWPGRIVVAVDARGGRVAVEGWANTAETTATDLAQRLADCGAAALVYTDIDRDGALTGANVEATAALAEAVPIPVIASGGVASLADLEALKAREASGLAGVICGRALYDGRLDPLQARRAVEGS